MHWVRQRQEALRQPVRPVVWRQWQASAAVRRSARPDAAEEQFYVEPEWAEQIRPQQELMLPQEQQALQQLAPGPKKQPPPEEQKREQREQDAEAALLPLLSSAG